MGGDGICEVCDNVNEPGVKNCEWCETTLPNPRRRFSTIGRRNRTAALWFLAVLLALAILVVVVATTRGGSNASPSSDATLTAIHIAAVGCSDDHFLSM